MKVVLEINNKAGCNFNQKKLELVVEKTIISTKLKKIFSKKIIISLGFVSFNEIQKINNKYRSKNFPTDILSFANYEKCSDFLEEKSDKIFLGELIVCCEDIEMYARKNNILVKEEITRVISHGILHLLGFTHGKEMFKIQNKIAKEKS